MADQAPDQEQMKTSEQDSQPYTGPTGQAGEKTLYSDYPAMFRSRPFRFVLYWLFVIAGFVGLALFFTTTAEDRYMFLGSIGGMALGILSIFLLLRWWIVGVLGTKLTVTNERTMVRRGILSRHTNEVWHDNVRNVQVYQTFMQRIFGVGQVQISSAGQGDVEIDVSGMPDPQKIREIINQHREE